MNADTLLAFAAAWGALVILPGPDSALIVARSIGTGRAAGLTTALGSLVALTGHVLFAALGVSAIIVSSSEAFTVLKLVGAAYLIVLGLRLILSERPGDPVAPDRRDPPAHLFRQAVLTGLLNPKSALFFLTFLPQFVDPRTPAGPQFFVLGLIVVAVAAAWELILITLAGRLRFVADRPGVRARIERLTGTVFVVLGTRLASTQR